MKRLILWSIACFLIPSTIFGQSYTAPGIASGSGLTFMPSTSIAPKAQFRLDIGRFEYASRRGSNSVLLGSGMSSNLETYVRFIGEQNGSIVSSTSIGYGGKFLIPLELPTIQRLAIWFESTSSEINLTQTIFPGRINRLAVLTSTGPNGSHALMMTGLATTGQKTNPLLGAGWVQPLSHSVLISPEIDYGYFGPRSFSIVCNAAIRIISNVSLQVSPGYLSANGVKTPMIAVGLSLSTVDFDFNERSVEKKTGYRVPTIEELEQQIKDGEKEGTTSPEGSGDLIPENGQDKSLGELFNDKQGKDNK